MAMESGSGLVEEEQRGVGCGFICARVVRDVTQIAHEFKALRFATGQGVKRLSEGEVAQTNRIER